MENINEELENLRNFIEKLKCMEHIVIIDVDTIEDCEENIDRLENINTLLEHVKNNFTELESDAENIMEISQNWIVGLEEEKGNMEVEPDYDYEDDYHNSEQDKDVFSIDKLFEDL